jgi:hypothetical protein
MVFDRPEVIAPSIHLEGKGAIDRNERILRKR